MNFRFSVGYQYPDGETCERFPEILSDYRDFVEELYFAPGNIPSGRSPAADSSGLEEDEAFSILKEDLTAISGMGIKRNMLFNGNCMGGLSVSRELEKLLSHTVEQFLDIGEIHALTTASPFIAKYLKKEFPFLEIRASVNMKIGTVEALEYAKEYFDSFCLQRDYNYRLDSLRSMAQWAGKYGKKVTLLANSGCLKNCFAQTFHDNLVSHLSEVFLHECRKDPNVIFCRDFYAKEENRREYLAHSTLIRPEDLFHYAEFTPHIKLATRTHFNVRMVLDAYTRGCFSGNLFDLSEPCHGIFYRGKVLDNSRIGKEYFAKKSTCSGNCRECRFCFEVLKNALIDCEELW